MIRFSAVAAAVAALVSMLVLLGTAGAATHKSELVGVVGQNNAYKITLSSGGTIAKKLKAGTYTIVIHDDSTFHNYELDGPNGKSWTFTTVPFTGTKTVTLDLTPGAYKAYCAPHESVMFQHFRVS